MFGQRGPGLVAVDDVMGAVPHRLGADRRKVGARTRLGITLAPPVLARENSRQKLLLLRLIAECVDHRANHGDAECKRGARSGPRRLLLKPNTSPHPPPGPPILFRPP